MVPVSDDGVWQVSVTAPVPCWSQLCGAAACPGRAAGRERLDPAGSGAGSRGEREAGSQVCRHVAAALFSRARGQGIPSGAVCLCARICAFVFAVAFRQCGYMENSAGTSETAVVLFAVYPAVGHQVVNGRVFFFFFCALKNIISHGWQKLSKKRHLFLFLCLNTEPISSSLYVLLWFWNGTFFHLLT